MRQAIRIGSAYVLLALGAAVAALATTAAQAEEARTSSPPATPLYATECGSCHVPYPTRMLNAAQWGQVLGQLERHYGVDASLDAATAAQVARYLHATPARANTNALPRITTQPWFREEHDEAGAAIFKSPSVKSASNCQACHAHADRGDFSEDSVRIPR